MKLLVLHNKEGAKTAGALLKKLKQLKVSASKALFDEDRYASELSSGEYLGAGNLYLAVISPGVFNAPWFAYFTGYARGRGKRLIGYGTDIDGIPALFADQMILFKSEGELEELLPGLLKDWEAQELFDETRGALLEMGVPFNAESFSNSVREKNISAVKLFLKAGFSPDARDKFGVPHLSLAARAGDNGIVKTLLKAGADINAQSADRGSSALIDCALGKYWDIARILVDSGADVNLKSKDGQSALIISVGLNDERFVEMLLKAGAGADEPDALGASARKYAALFNKPKIVELFTKYAGK
ncbi:MAG: ankyrin repeat domain-containing protein [Treponema sp.]|jgi:hypothetical protein|nr:ankyrin repeat domain-containing protein [Treponema sp.]